MACTNFGSYYKGFILLLFSLIFCFAASFGSTKKIRLYINAGNIKLVDTTYMPYYAYNYTKAFNAQSELLHAHINDTLIITIHNQDTKVHGFRVLGQASSFPNIPAGDSVTHTLSFNKLSTYIYYDDMQYPKYSYMGLAGIIAVEDNSKAKNFYWCMKSHEKAYNMTLSHDSVVDWNKFYPDYFTINSLSYPFLQKDLLSAITGNVGDTIRLYVINSGQSVHSIHFHGYHARAVYSSNPMQTGWMKDTHMMDRMQAMLLEIVPDKPGLYPVHDHNLVTMTGKGRYPNGMMIMMDIK